MSSVEDVVLAAAACVVLSTQRRPRRHWVKPSLKARSVYSGSDMLNDLQDDDVDPRTGEVECDGSIKNFLRMSSCDFEYLIQMVGHKIGKKDTNFRKAIPVRERLAITLRFLATGDSYPSIGYLFKVSRCAISKIVPEVCEALIDLLQGNIRVPSTQEEWLHHEKEYNRQWNFPHCIGAIDGKHISLQAPINSGSDFFNYRSFFSIVLLALVDANYCFTYVSVGCQGRLSDGGVFAHSALKEFLSNSKLNLPNPTSLPGKTYPVPYVIVADDAFPLMMNVMKPYPGLQEKGSSKRVYNYRHCRARRVVENVFGIVSVVFRVLRKPLLLEPVKAEKVVLACTHLHNFLRRSKSSSASYTPSGTFDYEDTSTAQLVPGQWRIEGMPEGTLLRLKKVPKKPTDIAKEVRDEICAFVNTPEGSVLWQEKY